MSEVITVELSVTNPALIAGIRHAMGLYNASLPNVQDKNEDDTPKVDENGNPVFIEPKPGTLDEHGYIMFVAVSAVKSYARQKVLHDFDEGDVTKSERDTALAAIEANAAV